MKRWLITGTGSGLGQAVAKAALMRGDAVTGIVRHSAAASAFEALAPGHARAIIADVRDRGAIFSGVADAIGQFGGIDLVVNNAGQVLETYVEEAEPAAVRALFDVNLLGALNVIQAILPHFRARRQGHVINISSGGGIVGVPSIGLYCASKFALEGMSEALAGEVGPLGIHVTIVEPGAFRTNLLASRTVIPTEIPDYMDAAGELRSRITGLGGHEPGDPARMAQAMLRLADAEYPPLRLPLGDDALAMALGKAASIQTDVAAWRDVATGLSYAE